MLGHALATARALAPDHLAVVIGHGREQVREHLDQLGDLAADVVVAVQEEQRGTGHAVGCALAALPEVTGAVVVTYGDVPLLEPGTLAALLAHHRDHGEAVTVLTALVEDPTGYGRLVRDADGTVTGIVEHKDATPQQREIREINSGIGVFDAAVLHSALQRLSPDNVQGELYLTDVLAIARADGHRVGALVCDDVWQTEGANDRAQVATLDAECTRRLLRRHMLAGVSVVDPARTRVDPDVTIEADATLLPGTALHGRTHVGAGAVVGPDTTLVDCTVGADAHVVRTHAVQADIGPRCQVGPFTYLRPGARLEDDAKAGAFVEIKASRVGPGSKVPHLSYVGDADIGSGANVGAATVVVNYDGVAKHRTVIGDHVRIGSDTMLVAPVIVGDGAYTAAGSVITQDVPPGAMAVARGRQRNVEGWVQRRRPGSKAAEAAERALRQTADDAAGGESA